MKITLAHKTILAGVYITVMPFLFLCGVDARFSCASPPPGLLFCEDFETLPLGTASSPKWSTDTANGTLTVERTTGNSGKQSLHVHTDDNGRAFLVLPTFTPPQNSFFGRMSIFVTAFPSAPDFAHYVLVEASGGPGTEVVRPLGGQQIPVTGGSPTDQWGVGSDLGPTGDWTAHQASELSVPGIWQCMEWQMNSADSAIDVFFDGVAQTALSVNETNHGGNQNVTFQFPTFSTIKFGWQIFQPNTTPSSFDMFIDDIALGTSRIGCC